MAKLRLAIKRLEEAGYTVHVNGTKYWVVNGSNTIDFFENGEGTDKVSKFTYSSKDSCSPTHGLNLKSAVEALGPVEYEDIQDASIHIFASGSGVLSLDWCNPKQDKYWTNKDMRLKHVQDAVKASERTYDDHDIFVASECMFVLFVPCDFVTIGTDSNYIACIRDGNPSVYKYEIVNLAEGQDASNFNDVNLIVYNLVGEVVEIGRAHV